MTFGILNRGNTHGFQSCMHCFSPRNKFKLQFSPYSRPFFYLAFDNKYVKGEQSDSGTLVYDEWQAAGTEAA